MNNQDMNSTNNYGLLAYGSSQDWEITIDESLSCDHEWVMEIDGPNLYVVFQINDLQVIAQSLDFLQKNLEQINSQGRLSKSRKLQDGMLTIGRFGRATVSLVWDTEDFIRCFFGIGAKAKSTIRFSLHEEDIKSLVKALCEVVENLKNVETHYSRFD